MKVKNLALLGLLGTTVVQGQYCSSNLECKLGQQGDPTIPSCCLYEKSLGIGQVGVKQTCRTDSYYNFYFDHPNYDQETNIWTNEYDVNEQIKVYCVDIDHTFEGQEISSKWSEYMAFDELNDKMLAIRETAKRYTNWFLIGGSVELVTDVFMPFAGFVGLINLLDYLQYWTFPGLEWLIRTFGVANTATDQLTRTVVSFIFTGISVVLKLALVITFAVAETNSATLSSNARNYHQGLMIWADRILANWGEATDVLEVVDENDMKKLYKFTVDSIALSHSLLNANTYMYWCQFLVYIGAPVCRIYSGANMIIWPANQFVIIK